MCNREISSRRIDWSFPRSSTTIRGRSPGGVVPPPPDRPRYEKCPDRARVNKCLSFMFKLSVTHQLCRAVRACFRAAPICDMLTHSLSTCGIECCARAPSDSGHDGGTLRHTGVPMELFVFVFGIRHSTLMHGYSVPIVIK